MIYILLISAIYDLKQSFIIHGILLPVMCYLFCHMLPVHVRLVVDMPHFEGLIYYFPHFHNLIFHGT